MIKLNEKYKALATSPDTIRYYIIIGGRASGKSYGASTFLTGLTFERGHKILYTRYTMKSAHVSIIPEFLEKIELIDANAHFDVNKTEITNKLTGDQILFNGINTSSGDQTAALKSIQGVTTWVLDEAEELMDEKTFDKIDLSIRQLGKHNRVILIMNPTTKEHWIYKRFFESKGIPDGFNGIKGDTCYIHTNYLDNYKNLSESFLKSVELMKSNRPEKYKHQILGAWLDRAEGVIFKDWLIGDFNMQIPSIFGQDFGFSTDPTVLVETAIDKKHKKIYIKSHYSKQAMTTSDIYDFNIVSTGKSLIIGDSAEPRLIHEVKSRGCNIIPTKKGAGSVLAGINLMLDYQLIIDPKSKELIQELNNYVWHDKKSGTPVDKYNHHIDAARYDINYQLANPNRGKYSIF
jgi:phage terminase large subunit